MGSVNDSMTRLLSVGKIMLIPCLVAAVSALALGQGTVQNAALPADVSRLKDELIREDIRMHDSLPRGVTEPYESWAEDYTEINEAGEVLGKAEVRERYRASVNRRPNIPPEEHAIRIYQDTLVMTHILKRKGFRNDKDGYPVIPTVYSSRVSHVFVKRDGQWRMILTQWTPLAQKPTE
jgi:hypothetical protein